MGAKESRIGFLSYEEALRRGEAGEGAGRAAGRPATGCPEGGRPGRGGAWGRLKRKGMEGRRWERLWGRTVGWEQCLEIGTVWKGAKLSQKERCLALAGKCLCSSVALFS